MLQETLALCTFNSSTWKLDCVMFVKHLFCIYLIWFVKRKNLLAFGSLEKRHEIFWQA